MKPRYRVVVAPGFAELEAAVNQAMDEGWQITGELHVDTMGGKLATPICYQAMLWIPPQQPWDGRIIEKPRCSKCRGTGLLQLCSGSEEQNFCTYELGRDLMKFLMKFQYGEVPNMGDPS